MPTPPRSGEAMLTSAPLPQPATASTATMTTTGHFIARDMDTRPPSVNRPGVGPARR
jgi:hypothetical protein